MPEQMRASSYIREGFIDGNALHEGRVIGHDPNGGIPQPLVLVETTSYKNQVPAELASLASGHAALNPEALGFIGRCQHYPTANGNRFPSQGRIEQLLYRSIKGIEVRMEDRGFHRDRLDTV
jgi:hypothetical protein